MVRFIEPVIIPNIGAWTAGDESWFPDALEKQLVGSGKAEYVIAMPMPVITVMPVEDDGGGG